MANPSQRARRLPRSFAVLLPVLAVSSAPSQAARPLSTDDAGVLAASECEWESFAAHLGGGPDPAASTEATLLSCGAGAATHLAVGFGRIQSGGHSQDSLSLGAKTRLPSIGPTVSTALGYGINAVRESGGGFVLQTSYAYAATTLELAVGTTGHLNLGWLRDRSARTNSTTWNFAIEQALDDRIALMAELYGDDRTAPWLGGGVRWTPTETFNLNASVGLQMDGGRRTLVSVGGKLAF
jgi:hypothetical protein